MDQHLGEIIWLLPLQYYPRYSCRKRFLKFLGHKIDYLAKELDKIMNEYPKFVAELEGKDF